MRVTRRRMLMISAAFAATPALAQVQRWQGRAFGAEVQLELHGPRGAAERALTEARRIIADTEARFSLYNRASDLSGLNRTGALVPTAPFLALMRAADRAYRLTGGLFDPTVQPLWQALAQGGDVAAARALVGWERLGVSAEQITLGPGQALTFNGIAQGFATDQVAAMLQARGFAQALVNIGEHRGLGGPWRLGLEDPRHGVVGTRTISSAAVATSSPMATPLSATGHILHPAAQPQWSTVSVEADTATLADALSTGLALAPLNVVRRVAATPGVRRITLVDAAGDIATL